MLPEHYYTLAICCTVFMQVTNTLSVQGSHSSLALLCIKLTCVLGLTWVFGFLNSVVKTDATAYLFVVVNSLQGEVTKGIKGSALERTEALLNSAHHLTNVSTCLFTMLKNGVIPTINP